MPEGRMIHADDGDASMIISSLLGRPLRLESQAHSNERTGIDRTTIFGDTPVSDLKPEWTAETMPDYFELRQDSFFEIGAIFLVTSGSIAHLRRLQGGTALIDRRRFRPNIYIHSGGEWSGFVEDAWLGGALTIGGALMVDDFQPTLWCVTATLAQEELPRDLSILRTTAVHHRGCLGVYGAVKSAGLVHVGDPVILWK